MLVRVEPVANNVALNLDYLEIALEFCRPHVSMWVMPGKDVEMSPVFFCPTASTLPSPTQTIDTADRFSIVMPMKV